MINNSLPVEEVDAEVVPFTAMGSQGELIKDDNDELITKQLDFILSDLSKDFKDKYKDKVVFIDAIPVEKQHEFVELFKTNDKETINTTLEIIMNDYSKDKTEIIHSHPIIIEDNIFDDNDNAMELFNYAYHLTETKYFDDMKKYGKNCIHTTKRQPSKKSKKSARRNNRQAKRNNR